MKNTRDDRARYRTVEVLNPHTGLWQENARRVTPRVAEATLANLQSFGHTARIVPNVYYRGVFGPTADPQ